MERSRENRRKPIFSSSRRRSGVGGLKESSVVWRVEDRGIDSMRERFSSRDQRSRGRRRRSSRLSPNDSSEESSDVEMEEEAEQRMERTRSHHAKVADEIIRVPVPRRARSALKRRPPDSFATAWPSNALKEVSEKMVSISESEVEIANFLYGLTKLHSQPSDATAESFQNSLQPDISVLSKGPKRKKSSYLQSDDTEKPAMIIACSSKAHRNKNIANATGSGPTLHTEGCQEDKNLCIKEMDSSSSKLDADSSSNNNSHSTMEALILVSQNPIPISVQSEGKPVPHNAIHSKLLKSQDLNEQPNSTYSKKVDGNCKPLDEKTDQTEKESDQINRDAPCIPTQDDKLDLPRNSPASVVECVKEVKFEIDLMALPENASPYEGEVDGENSHLSYTKKLPINDQNHSKSEATVGLVDKMDIEDPKGKHDSSVLNLDTETHMKGVAEGRIEKQTPIDERTGSYQDEKNPGKMNAKQHSQKPLKCVPPKEIMVPISTSIPVSVPCWPGGLQPVGKMDSCGVWRLLQLCLKTIKPILSGDGFALSFKTQGGFIHFSPLKGFRFRSASSPSLSVAPSVQRAIPVEGNTFMTHEPFIMLPSTRRGHCSTHCFIAQLINFQQQVVRLNPFWHAAGASDKPYNLSTLPQSGALVPGGPVLRNPNTLSNGSCGSGSVITLNCQYPKVNLLNCSQGGERRKPLLNQPHHQGGVFLFPINQSQTADSKASRTSENESSVPKSSASSTASASASTTCSNLSPVPDPRYLAMFKRSYPFSNMAAYQPYITSQQQTLPPFFCGNPTQLYPLQLIQDPTASTGSSTQKHLQINSLNNSSKPSSEVRRTEFEDSRKYEFPHSQKKFQNQRLPAGKQSQLPSSLPSQAKTLSKAHYNSSSEPLESNHLRNQFLAQTNSPISTLPQPVSTAESVACSDQNSSQWRMSSSQRMAKAEISLENTSSKKLTLLPSAPTAVGTKQSLFPNSAPGHRGTPVQLTFPGSLNMRPTISQQAQRGSSMGLKAMAAVSYANGAASLPMKSAEQKPAAA